MLDVHRKNTSRHVEGDSVKRRRIVFGVMLFCLILTGCQEKEKEKVEITLIHGWGTMEEEHIRMREIYQDFEKEYPDIKLNLMSMTSSEEVVEKVGNMLSVGEIPDLVFMGGYGKDSVYRFMVENEKALDLMPYLEKDKDFKQNIAPEIISYWEQNGHLYTLSDVLLAAGGYWYNEEIFKQVGIEEVPVTWEEFFDVCDRIQKWSEESGSGVIPVIVTQENSTYLADAFLLDASESKEKELMPNSIEVEDDEYRGVLEAIRRMNQYDTESGREYGYRDVGSMFNSQKTAIYVNGVWAGKLIDEKINARYAAFPGREGKSSSCLSACIGYVVGNTTDKEKRDASVKFLKYILSEEVQERILLETGQMPSNPQVDLEDYKQQEPRLYQSVQEVRQADRKIEVPNNLWTTEQIEVFQNGILNELDGKKEETEFIAAFKRK